MTQDTVFLPRGTCPTPWPQWLIAEYHVAEGLTFIVYMAVAVAFQFFLRKRHVRILKPLFSLLAFVFATCGLTHIIGLLTFWKPWFHLDAAFRMFSGAVGVVALIIIARFLPMVMKMPRVGAVADLYEEVAALRARLSHMEHDKASEILQVVIADIRSKAAR